MRFRDFLRMAEADQNPALDAVKKQVGQAVQNNASAPSMKDKTAGDITKKSLLDVARQKPAMVDALTNQAKKPVLGAPQMMKKK